MLKCELNLSRSGWGPVVGSCVQGSELQGSVKDVEFPMQLSDHQRLKSDYLWG